ncbi:YccF domain-containing protein [Saccharopolyspora indica]|uniref:YccF domain-containing protein n=1 Tax=Saccharopolyspora indica TaxID=1229659 RepID=UPI0022EB49B6|nr:YccF domain-containing protein [Saccharopolyspora indica]MDA3648260.1 YccF domain-containing protein [Saccharopolyspora indica]
MRLLLNVIWLVFGGLWMALGYAFAGILLAITVIGIPFAIASFRMANFALWPFGRRLVDEPASGAMAGIGNVLWLILAGWWLALGHIVTGIAQCITIIGIPLGIANFKLIPVSLMPLGKRVVDADDAYAFMRSR